MSWPTIGLMRHRLRVETPVDVDDGAGGFKRTYRTMIFVWARVRTFASDQQFLEQKFEQTRNYQVDIRWREDIAPGMRFVFRDSILLIHALRDPDGARRFLTCACEEIV